MQEAAPGESIIKGHRSYELVQDLQLGITLSLAKLASEGGGAQREPITHYYYKVTAHSLAPYWSFHVGSESTVAGPACQASLITPHGARLLGLYGLQRDRAFLPAAGFRRPSLSRIAPIVGGHRPFGRMP